MTTAKKINQLIPFKITLSKDLSSCAFSYTYDEKEVFTLHISGQITAQNQNEINYIANNYGISQAELLREVSKLCRSSIPVYMREGHKTRCKYFKNLERFIK